MTLSRSVVSQRAASIRSAFLRADRNHDGKLSAAERSKAAGLVSGAAREGLVEAFKQARLRSGFTSVSRGRSLVSLAEHNALRADRNRNGVSASERGTLSGPIARALTRGATGTGGAAPVGGSGSVKGLRATSTMRALARASTQVARSMGGYRGLGLCATGVSRAIARAMHLSVHGNGNQIDNNLPRRHFKQIHISLRDALKIPGLVLTWERTSSALGRKYGHTAITLGNGRSSASDFIERNTLYAGGRSGLKIFLPI
ncbi:MAG: peptidoglycan-binding protein [Myxococcaceae bacterium]